MISVTAGDRRAITVLQATHIWSLARHHTLLCWAPVLPLLLTAHDLSPELMSERSFFLV